MTSILGKGPYINEGQDRGGEHADVHHGPRSAYSGQKITWDMIMNSKQDLMPKKFD